VKRRLFRWILLKCPGRQKRYKSSVSAIVESAAQVEVAVHYCLTSMFCNWQRQSTESCDWINVALTVYIDIASIVKMFRCAWKMRIKALLMSCYSESSTRIYHEFNYYQREGWAKEWKMGTILKIRVATVLLIRR